MSNESILSEDDVIKRRDDAIRRALSTPPAPTKAIRGKPRKSKKDAAKSASSQSDQGGA